MAINAMQLRKHIVQIKEATKHYPSELSRRANYGVLKIYNRDFVGKIHYDLIPYGSDDYEKNNKKNSS